MSIYKRYLNLTAALGQKSHFLLGPRGTGKTTLWKGQLTDCVSFDLLRSEIFLRLSANPSLIEGMIDAACKGESRIIVIDEVQRIPELLNEVHRLIEERQLTFLLTGSSARKLKRGGANLLAGRAWILNLFPLVSAEIPDFDLLRVLQFGSLPFVLKSANPGEELDAYVHTYLYEEIMAEGLVRNLPRFSRFLQSAAVGLGEPLNFTNIANDCQVPASTVREFYQILEDTLLGFQVEAFTKTKLRVANKSAKFYFFDTGVSNCISAVKNLEPKSDLFGKCFEQFIACELKSWISYSRAKFRLQYWRSKNGAEVDFILNETVAIEVKSAEKVRKDHLKGLHQLKEEKILKKYILVSLDPIETIQDGIESKHWKTFLKELWMGDIC